MNVTNNTLTRREALQLGAIATATAAAASSTARAQGKKLPRIDAHLHCFAGKDDQRFPYHERAPYKPEPAATPPRPNSTRC